MKPQPKGSACALKWTEIGENKQMRCVVVEAKSQIKGSSIWSDFKRLQTREFKPKHDKIQNWPQFSCESSTDPGIWMSVLHNC